MFPSLVWSCTCTNCVNLCITCIAMGYFTEMSNQRTFLSRYAAPMLNSMYSHSLPLSHLRRIHWNWLTLVRVKACIPSSHTQNISPHDGKLALLYTIHMYLKDKFFPSSVVACMDCLEAHYLAFSKWALFTIHRYRAPECLLTDGHYNHKMDMWSVGCVLFEVMRSVCPALLIHLNVSFW